MLSAFCIWSRRLLGGSWDLVSKDISTLIAATSTQKYGYLISNPVPKSHDPLGNLQADPRKAAIGQASQNTDVEFEVKFRV